MLTLYFVFNLSMCCPHLLLLFHVCFISLFWSILIACFIDFAAKPDLEKTDPGEHVTLTWHPHRRFDPTVSGSKFIIVHYGVDILYYNSSGCYLDPAVYDYVCVYEDNGLSLGVNVANVNVSHAGDYGIRLTYNTYDDVLINNDAQLYIFRKFNNLYACWRSRRSKVGMGIHVTFKLFIKNMVLSAVILFVVYFSVTRGN